jgi:hypothetical protein
VDHRQRVLVVVILTFLITLSVGFLTEYVRQSMTFSWAIEESDEILYDVTVTGLSTTPTQSLPPSFAIMNNTRIMVQIVSLPNVSIIFYATSFIDDVVEYMKTGTTFANGTEIPTGYRVPINNHISQCILPVGGWKHLDSLFPNRVDRPYIEHETYLAVLHRNYFLFGYSSNETTDVHEWQATVDIETGVPQTVWFYIYHEGQPWTNWYNVSMSIVT